MTLQLLKTLAILHDIPDTVTLMSNSGWELDATNINCAYYNKKENILIFTQFPDKYYDMNSLYECIYGNNKCKGGEL